MTENYPKELLRKSQVYSKSSRSIKNTVIHLDIFRGVRFGFLGTGTPIPLDIF